MSSPLAPRNPWPMKWIALAIVVFIAAYTYLTLHYRKPNRPYQPAHDMKQRANTGRLLSAGYQRVEINAIRPADGAPPADTTMPAPGGLPEELKTTLVSTPLLPTDVVSTHAAGTATSSQPYVIQIRCVGPDDHHQFSGAELYVKGDAITIAPRLDHLSGGLQARTIEHRAIVTIPPGTLKPGHYRATVVGERTSRSWLLQVN